MKDLRILVVDDVSVHRYLVTNGLGRLHPFWQLDQASGGLEAQEKLKQNRYDVIICDWVMEDMNGAELLKWSRSFVATSKIPFIMMSAKDGKEDIIQAFMDLKVDGYIVKPFTVDDISKKIHSVLEIKS